MKLIDRAIDYVTNRVLDRVAEREAKPAIVVNNAHAAAAGASAGQVFADQMCTPPSLGVDFVKPWLQADDA